MKTDKATATSSNKLPRVYDELKARYHMSLTPTARKWLTAQRKLMPARSYADVIEILARREPPEPPTSA